MGFKFDICCDPDVVARIQEFYEVVYQKKEINNGIIGVTFAKAIIFEKGGEDVNQVLYVAQVLNMGAKGHKGKGNVDNECKKKAKFARGIFSRSIICLDSPGGETKESMNSRTKQVISPC